MRQFSRQSVPESMISNKTDNTLTRINRSLHGVFKFRLKTSNRMSIDTAGKSAVSEINNLTKFKGVGSLTD